MRTIQDGSHSMKHCSSEVTVNIQTVPLQLAGKLIDQYHKRNTPIDIQYGNGTATILIHSEQIPVQFTHFAKRRQLG